MVAEIGLRFRHFRRGSKTELAPCEEVSACGDPSRRRGAREARCLSVSLAAHDLDEDFRLHFKGVGRLLDLDLGGERLSA